MVINIMDLSNIYLENMRFGLIVFLDHLSVSSGMYTNIQIFVRAFFMAADSNETKFISHKNS